MADAYKLIIQSVQAGRSVEQVAEALAAQLRRPTEQLLPALRSGQAIQLTLRGLDIAQALGFKNTVEATGCSVTLDALQALPSEQATSLSNFEQVRLRPFASPATGLRLHAPADWRDVSEGELFRVRQAGSDAIVTASFKRSPGLQLSAWAQLRFSAIADKMPYLQPFGAPYSLQTAAGPAVAAEFRGVVPGDADTTHQLVLCLCPAAGVVSLNVTASAAAFAQHQALYQWLLRTQLHLLDDTSALPGHDHPASLYDQGMRLAQRGQMEEAVRCFRQSAERGHADAQYSLGQCYLRGEGVARDLLQTFQWWRRSAEQGHAGAQFNLASMYEQGDGTQRDLVQSFHWRLKAAEQGDPEAQYAVAVCYVQGKGVPENLHAAGQWTLKAAAQGHPGAQFYAAAMHEHGQGLPRDPHRALAWYEKAAAQGHGMARDRLRELGL